MSNGSEGRKKSQFIQQSTVDGAATFDFVINRVNRKITLADLITVFGTTGTLEQIGNVLGTPILNKSGSVNNIRNLEDGSGVKASVSAQNGVTLDHNFTVNQIGSPIMTDITAISPVLGSLVGGTGISIAAGTGTIIITATGLVQASNLVIINVEGDFPVQDASTITLSSKKIFVIGADLSTAKRFILEDGAVITMANQFGNTLTYTGTGAMFTGTDVSATVEIINLSSPNATETFSISDATGTKRFVVRQASIVNTPKWGTYTGLIAAVIESSSASPASQGLTINSTTMNVLNINSCALASSSASFVGVDLGTSIIPNIDITDLIIIAPAGAVGLKGAAASANVPAGFLAKLLSSSFSGGMTDELSGIARDDVRWSFDGNTGIEDTRPDGLISLTGNATETVISASSTDGSEAVLVAGTWVAEEEHQYSGSTAGRITYNGERDFHAPIDFPISLSMASGGSKQIGCYIAINGAVKLETRQIITATSAQGATAPVSWQHTFAEGDFVELFVENRTDTTNIIVSDSVGRAN